LPARPTLSPTVAGLCVELAEIGIAPLRRVSIDPAAGFDP